MPWWQLCVRWRRGLVCCETTTTVARNQPTNRVIGPSNLTKHYDTLFLLLLLPAGALLSSKDNLMRRRPVLAIARLFQRFTTGLPKKFLSQCFRTCRKKIDPAGVSRDMFCHVLR
jgi:hypothetical protein